MIDTPLWPMKLMPRQALVQNCVVKAGSAPITSGFRLSTISASTRARILLIVKISAFAGRAVVCAHGDEQTAERGDLTERKTGRLGQRHDDMLHIDGFDLHDAVLPARCLQCEIGRVSEPVERRDGNAVDHQSAAALDHRVVEMTNGRVTVRHAEMSGDFGQAGAASK